MITIHEATQKARSWFEAKGYTPLNLRRQNAIEMPDGWRLVYETVLGEHTRIRQTLLIVFIDPNAADPIREHADFAEGDLADLSHEINRLLERLTRQPPPPLEDALRKVRLEVAQHFPGRENQLEILYNELVIDRMALEKEDMAVLAWRVVYLDPDGECQRSYVRYESEAPPPVAAPPPDPTPPLPVPVAEPPPATVTPPMLQTMYQPYQSGEAPEITMDEPTQVAIRGVNRRKWGRIDFSGRNRGVKIKVDLGTASRASDAIGITPARLLEMRSELMVWYCKQHCAAYLDRLGFRDIDFDAIQLRHAEARDVRDGPNVATPFGESGDGTPIEPHLERGTEVIFVGPHPVLRVTYALDKMLSWAEAPSVIFHELAHAVSFLLYVPRIEGPWNEAPLHRAIEEGFADFFSAIMMADLLDDPTFAAEIGIGGDLPDYFQKVACLPRVFDASSYHTDGACSRNDLYQLGMQWASFLWDVRSEIGDQHVADQIILSAHFRPNLPPFANGADLFAAYQRAIQAAFARMGHPNILPNWDVIVQRHSFDFG